MRSARHCVWARWGDEGTDGGEPTPVNLCTELSDNSVGSGQTCVRQRLSDKMCRWSLLPATAAGGWIDNAI